MDIKQLISWATKELRSNKVSEPGKSAELLLCQFLLWDKAKMLSNMDYNLTSKQEKEFREYIERRKKHEPVWYITGKIEFYGLDLKVDENVLIPRPETEFLVEEVLTHVGNKRGLKILEVGTGSGAVALALADRLKFKVYASDVSGDALKVAKKNAKRLKLDKYVEFRQGDLLEPWRGEKFDCLVANLPYIPHEEMSTLSLDIHHWEPRVALDGGKDGLEVYERVLGQAEDCLNKGAIMFFEIGIKQGKKLKKLVKKYLPEAKVEIKKDYGDIDRIAIISFKSA